MGNCTTYAGGKHFLQSASPKSWCQPKKPTISLRNSMIATLVDILEGKRRAIIQRYHWPGMEEDIRKWVLQCPQSQSKRAFIKEKVEYTPIEVTEPLELVGMDPVGKLTAGNFAIRSSITFVRGLASKEACARRTPTDKWAGGNIKWHNTKVPEQTGGGSAQTVGPTPPRDDVCSENENPADHKVQPLFSDVWKGGEVPVRGAREVRNNGRESQQLGANGGSLRGTQKTGGSFRGGER
ncbi:hypothetical protein KUCAC02_016430 [Chaenocephalus aceratus]|nr:hypothetical protein KUCAC02_016430 [Chaenocephalus aceratus]